MRYWLVIAPCPDFSGAGIREKKICVLELMKGSVACFVVFGSENLLQGISRAFGLWPQILAAARHQIYAGNYGGEAC